ncbi:MAG: undecaprenyl-diphosphate phosphatase [Candidatus Omnitrophica bacterium]|nr:undecaprenyl-diphosphate phosphatase [Candidatus Omnitrophota bacterium]
MKLELLILSFVQGIAEFLPISSSGHLVLLAEAFNLKTDRLSFVVFLHIATLASVIVYFFPVIIRFAKEKYGIANIAFAFFATASISLAIKNYTRYFYNDTNLYMLGVFFLVSGACLFLSDFKKTNFKSITVKTAALIGIAQGFALLPGISRSGITIAVALLLGSKRQEAFEFSFLLAIPTVACAGIYEFVQSPDQLCFNWAYLVYFLTAFLFGILSLHFLKIFILRKKLSIFGIYCCIIGLVTLFLGG